VRLPRAVVLCVLLTLAAPCWTAWAQADANPSLVDSFEAARSRRDVEAAVALFTDDAVIRDRSGREHVGKEQIRQFMLLTASRGRTLPVAVHAIGNNRIAWTERITTQVSTLEFNVEAVVQDGRIKALIYGDGVGSGRVEPLTDTSGSLPALLGVGTVALVLSASVAVVSLGLPRRELAGSALEGHLVTGLQQWAATRRRPAA
jgi:hypothetical protein